MCVKKTQPYSYFWDIFSSVVFIYINLSNMSILKML